MGNQNIAVETVQEMKVLVEDLFLRDLKEYLEKQVDMIDKTIQASDQRILGDSRELKETLPKQVLRNIENSEVVKDLIKTVSQATRNNIAVELKQMLSVIEKNCVDEVQKTNLLIEKMENSLQITAEQILEESNKNFKIQELARLKGEKLLKTIMIANTVMTIVVLIALLFV